MLGGSSGLNFMLHVRGNPEDFQEWERQGNPGWGYQDILAYFEKSEKKSFESSSEDALLPVSDNPFVTPLSEDILAMARDNGFDIGQHKLDSLNQTSFYKPLVNQMQGRRADTFRT